MIPNLSVTCTPKFTRQITRQISEVYFCIIATMTLGVTYSPARYQFCISSVFPITWIMEHYLVILLIFYRTLLGNITSFTSLQHHIHKNVFNNLWAINNIEDKFYFHKDLFSILYISCRFPATV